MIDLPFNSSDFAEAWADFIDFKKRVHESEYTSRGMKSALRRLKRESLSNEEIAIAMLDRVLETEGNKKPWMSFHPLKDDDPLIIKQKNEQTKPQKKKDASEILKERYGINY